MTAFSREIHTINER
ncbi:hypothetical protein M3Y94_01173700 [Aphelenchoides besseyi]|nr:hypothetical protein M3Y94_01173700 [Aphelenchoides besseyi]